MGYETTHHLVVLVMMSTSNKTWGDTFPPGYTNKLLGTLLKTVIHSRKIKCSNLGLDFWNISGKILRILRIFLKPGENPFSLLTLIIWIFNSENTLTFFEKPYIWGKACIVYIKYLFRAYRIFSGGVLGTLLVGYLSSDIWYD